MKERVGCLSPLCYVSQLGDCPSSIEHKTGSLFPKEEETEGLRANCAENGQIPRIYTYWMQRMLLLQALSLPSQTHPHPRSLASTTQNGDWKTLTQGVGPAQEGRAKDTDIGVLQDTSQQGPIREAAGQEVPPPVHRACRTVFSLHLLNMTRQQGL